MCYSPWHAWHHTDCREAHQLYQFAQSLASEGGSQEEEGEAAGGHQDDGEGRLTNKPCWWLKLHIDAGDCLQCKVNKNS